MYIKQIRLLSTLLLLLTVFASGLQAQDIPDPMSPPRLVNDFAGMLSPQEQSSIEEMLRAYNDSTSTQIYVVTVSTFNGYDKSQYATELGEKWKIGQKSKNNGAVLLIKPKSGNERGELFIAAGYGLEGALPDAICKRIIDQTIIPHFRQGAYYDGIKSGILQMISCLSGEYMAEPPNEGGVGGTKIISIIIIALIILVVVSRMGGGGQNMGSGGSGSSGGGMFFPSSRGGGFGGFSGGSGSFGGGGGGSFGGGGAGGSW